MDKSLRPLLTQTVVISTAGPSTRDVYGRPTWSTGGSTYRARVSYQRAFFRDHNGDNYVPLHIAWIESTVAHSTEHRFTLPDGTSPPAVTVEQFYNLSGIDHERVRFGNPGQVSRRFGETGR